MKHTCKIDERTSRALKIGKSGRDLDAVGICAERLLEELGGKGFVTMRRGEIRRVSKQLCSRLGILHECCERSRCEDCCFLIVELRRDLGKETGCREASRIGSKGAFAVSTGLRRRP